MSAWREHLERELGAECLRTAEQRVEVAPDSVEGLRAALAVAREHGLVVQPVGRGSKASWCAPAERVDLVLSTRRLEGIVSYEPGDGTLTARAGATPAALAAAVREGGHHLTPDVPWPERATLGGVIAAGQSGSDRLRYGPARNALLGARVLLADGRLARSGGQLVKNVTGYDLHRLYCGSHGTLAVIVEASLRLHPLPEARRVLWRAAGDRRAALAAARAVLAVPARHVAVWCHDAETEGWRVFCALGGRADVVDHEAALVRDALGGAGPVEEAEGEAAAALAAAERDRAVDADGAWPALALGARRTALERALDRVEAAARELGLAPGVIAHPGVAEALVRLPGLTPEQAEALAPRLADLPARVAWRLPEAAALGARPPAPALALMRRLRDALDPDARFARDRLAGVL